MRQSRGVRWVSLLVIAACGGEAPRPEPPPSPVPADDAIPPSPQRAGDPQRGWAALVGEGYVGCGVPRTLWDRFGGAAGEAYRIDRPDTRARDLPYFMNLATIDGVDVVTANCLGCHAGFLRGKLVIGLGEVSMDFAVEASQPLAVASMMVGGAERDQLTKLAGRVRTLEAIHTQSAGANPADHIAAVLFAHRDPKTLAWSDTPRIPYDTSTPAIPIDVPAWWLLKKKSAMFHTGAGRGDQARIMMTASVMCVDDVATARSIDAYFPDIRAYVLSLEPPTYPDPIDARLATAGKRTFDNRCAKCHGTYGPSGRYRERVIGLAQVGTDPALAQHAGQFAARFTEWFNHSFYGEIARLEPGNGYVAPPLDGVWATAPYLHNGSVPNLAALLDSSRRLPRTAIVRGAKAYDLDAVGWPNTAPTSDDPRWIYDTGRVGYSNAGHTFGDRLTPDERAGVIEYLKTL